ncbi:hypothetical protein ACIQVR_39625 [Streptomyces xanthochromogenes]|uniref:hypothetical protein n=1 Tax=Streptomyces xanthochromogenes TaxID=67384 RepID=UPI00381D6420
MTASENVVDHLHQLFFGELGLCGCGARDAAFDLVRNLLTLVPQDETARTRPPS